MKKSYIIWLLIGFIIEIAIFIYSNEALYVIWSIGSFYFIINGFGSYVTHNSDEFPWYFWFPISWILAILLIIAEFIYSSIGKSYNWIANKIESFNKKN